MSWRECGPDFPVGRSPPYHFAKVIRRRGRKVKPNWNHAAAAGTARRATAAAAFFTLWRCFGRIGIFHLSHRKFPDKLHKWTSDLNLYNQMDIERGQKESGWMVQEVYEGSLREMAAISQPAANPQNWYLMHRTHRRGRSEVDIDVMAKIMMPLINLRGTAGRFREECKILPCFISTQ